MYEYLYAKKVIQEEGLNKEVSTNILVGLVESLLGGDDQEKQRRIIANLIKIISNT
jgi:hypothetical protein